ncbi:MAG: methyltransferase family protein [Planctomycetota bacterium]|jgi:protein-S-isoprenylcysteine O-methyltransferase Ste14
MQIKNTKIEWFLKSFVFSFILFAYVGFSAVKHTQSLLNEFDYIELLRIIYSVSASLFFLIRIKPSIVSMNPVHWVIALITSFSALFFIRESPTNSSILLYAANVFVVLAHILGIPAILTLGRSFGFFPALRKVKTKYIYQIIRHPMYLASIFFRIGYVLNNLSIFNVILLVVILILYDKRAKFEEDILSQSSLYADYTKKIRYRFIPGLY